jgi:hypothetical protein
LARSVFDDTGFAKSKLDLAKGVAKRSGVVITQVWGSRHNQSGHGSD